MRCPNCNYQLGNVVEPISKVTPQARKWHDRLFKPAPGKPNWKVHIAAGVNQIVIGNCLELIAMGVTDEEFDRHVLWIEQSTNKNRPNSPETATDPMNWNKWEGFRQKEIEEMKRRKR